MKKKLLWIISILLVLVLFATLVGPSIVLNAVRQPEPAEAYAYRDSFYTGYDQIRAHLQDLTKALDVDIYSHAIDAEDVAARVRKI